MVQVKHDCKEELKSAGLKATPARLALLKLFEKTEMPLDVSLMQEYLTKHNIDADPATVFRIINMFTQKGITKQVQLGEGKFRYELTSREDHHHLICENCGDIEDISDCDIEGLEKQINKKKKFLVKRHSLEFFGVCKRCQR